MIITVSGARRDGKTSLALALKDALKKAGYRVRWATSLDKKVASLIKTAPSLKQLGKRKDTIFLETSDI